jgi:hypothetical protein
MNFCASSFDSTNALKSSIVNSDSFPPPSANICKFIGSNEDAQKFIQSQSQSAADKQLEAWKQNNLDKLKQEELQKLYFRSNGS